MTIEINHKSHSGGMNYIHPVNRNQMAILFLTLELHIYITSTVEQIINLTSFPHSTKNPSL